MKKSEKRADVIAKGIFSYLKKNNEVYLLENVLSNLSKWIVKEKVKVTSPRALTKSEQEKVFFLTKKLIKDETLKVDFLEDGTLIDGLKIEYKDRMWDLSLRKQINSLFKDSQRM